MFVLVYKSMECRELCLNFETFCNYVLTGRIWETNTSVIQSSHLATDVFQRPLHLAPQVWKCSYWDAISHLKVWMQLKCQSNIARLQFFEILKYKCLFLCIRGTETHPKIDCICLYYSWTCSANALSADENITAKIVKCTIWILR